jgi:DNA-binding transcriptional MerR regulator
MLNEAYSSIGAVADRIGIPRWKLAYMIERGDVPPPSLQVPGRRLFSERDIERIIQALEARHGASAAR